MKLSLRPHQSQALNVMKDKDCGQIIVPTGGGKTYIMIQDCINDVNSELTVIVAPRIPVSYTHLTLPTIYSV